MLIVILIVRVPFLAAADTVAWSARNPVIAALAVVLGRVLWSFVKPYRRCRWCRPGGLIGGSVPFRLAGYKPKPRRNAQCWRCEGRRLTRRLGAYHAHKLRLSLIQAWAERGDER